MAVPTHPLRAPWSTEHPDAFLILSDTDTAIRAVNDRYAHALGVHASERVGLRWMDALTGEERIRVRRDIAACTPQHAAFVTETCDPKPDGTELWVRWVHQGQFENGRLVAFHSVGTDITARKRRERHEVELLEAVPDIFLRIDREHRFQDQHVGRGGQPLLPPGEFLGKRMDEILPFDVAREAGIAIDRVFRTGKSTTFEYSLRFPHGTRWFESRIFLEDQDMVTVVVRDTTAQHTMLKALERARRDYATIFEGTDEAIFLVTVEDDGFRFQRVNPALLRRTGFGKADLEGRRIEQALPPDIAAFTHQRFTECATTDTQLRFQAEVPVPTGLRTWDVTLTPVKEADRVRFIIGSALDITEKVRAEKNLIDALREKTVLLAEIHHRVKNNLAIVDSLLELQKDHTDAPDIRVALQESQFRIKTMALIHEMLYKNDSFSRIAFDAYIRELGAHIHRAQGPAGGGITLEFDTQRLELPMTGSVPAALAFNEILNNAFKHAFGAGEPGRIRVILESHENHVTLTITDNGIGYDPDRNGREEGLGITLIRTLAEQLGGSVRWIIGDGTRVELVFPAEPNR